MLQRIQTLYLLLVILLSGPIAFFAPFLLNQDKEQLYLKSMIQTGEVLLIALPALFLISSGMALLTLISFKNRTRQIIYNRLNIVINFLLLGIVVYHQLKLPGEAFVSEKGIGVFIPLLTIVLLALANKAIIKDDKLVKSVDRLR